MKLAKDQGVVEQSYLRSLPTHLAAFTMNTVSESSADGELSATQKGAIVILGNRVLSEIGFETVSGVRVTQALGVARSHVYELADRLFAALPSLVAPPAPPAPREDAVNTARLATAKAVIDYLVEHPGAMVAGPERHRYSDRFRRFVIRLQEPSGVASSLSLPDLAEATRVPQETLRDWLSGRRRARLEPGAEDDFEPPPYEEHVLEHVVQLWRQCRGITVATFTRILAEQHRIKLPVKAVVDILELSGDRARSRPRKPKPDPEAIRGALERFFPGAQWVLDGTSVDVTIDGETFRFNWELSVDAFSGAHVGFDVSDEEDGQALIDAIDHGSDTTGALPLSVLSDNRPSNHSPQVDEALTERGVFPMASTPFRPENKASVEGAYGLFSQTMPPITLRTDRRRELARQVLVTVLTAYCCGRNHVPRPGLDKRSAAEVYEGACPTDEERERAKERLREIDKRIRSQRERDREQADPVCRQLLTSAFAELGLADPEGHFIPAIAKNGLDAVTEAIAVLRHILGTGSTLSSPERYLLAIASNVAQRDQSLAVYEDLVELRVHAQDELLAPLRERQRRLHDELEREPYIDAVLDAALTAEVTIDRAYWRNRFFEAFDQLGILQRAARGRRYARIVAVSYKVPREERNAIISRLASRGAADRSRAA